MSAADVTPERFAELRLLEKHLCASGQMVGACLRESLAALESAWAERDAYLEEVLLTNENEARIMADLLATREERDRLRAELAARTVAVEVPGMDDNTDLLPILEEAAKDLDCGRIALNAWIVKYANPIPTSRILKDGEVAVRADNLFRLRAFASMCKNCFDHDPDAHKYGTTCRVCAAEDALRYGEAEGGRDESSCSM